MTRTNLLALAYALDRIAGDPEWYPHPVRLMGRAISKGEMVLRHPEDTGRAELISGALLTVGVVGGSYWVSAGLLSMLRQWSAVLADLVELLLAWNCVAVRNLEQEAKAVTGALAGGDLALARARLARIVGRDTAALDASEVSRGVIETVAESASDGIVAPLFYLAVGGVPMALAYKAVNTLDSMIGHADDRYFFFGKVAARLDDVANLLPSRLTALALVAASGMMERTDAAAAWGTWRRDNTKHKSPNAGQPESAMAGALGVRLGGDNTYSGERIHAPLMGREFPAPGVEDAVRSIRLVAVASLLALGMCLLLTRTRVAR